MKKHQQAGFTLVEIAIVLVIIGLLLGGVLKGQEMISSAKVKALANEIRAVSAAYYGYQDRFRSIPGDDVLAATTAHLGATVNGATIVTPTAANAGNGRINTGTWVGTAAGVATAGNESSVFWNHARAGGFLTGDAGVGSASNSVGGKLGITSNTVISTITASTVFVCSGALDNKIAAQLDSTMDDGLSNTGGVQAVVGAAVTASTPAAAAYTINNIYTICTGI
ncbi:prepilin-type N-terminal cleavage/methylation domain-containing protein [Ampullimonas aquatilis]|uniref:prepilin-type N-terminal cleavage/methylation domain-containing protein n=1 Tax=Ampullimonas aquatilis TaxID=1341549 RepID=UPI003C74B9EB